MSCETCRLISRLLTREVLLRYFTPRIRSNYQPLHCHPSQPWAISPDALRNQIRSHLTGTSDCDNGSSSPRMERAEGSAQRTYISSAYSLCTSPHKRHKIRHFADALLAPPPLLTFLHYPMSVFTGQRRSCRSGCIAAVTSTALQKAAS